MNGPDPKHELVAHRLMRHLRSYVQGLGLDEATAWQIIDRVIAEMPDATDVDRQAEARHRMLQAAL